MLKLPIDKKLAVWYNGNSARVRCARAAEFFTQRLNIQGFCILEWDRFFQKKSFLLYEQNIDKSRRKRKMPNHLANNQKGAYK